jgi:hypothetical protein
VSGSRPPQEQVGVVRDDLTHVKGVGPAIERQLQNCGVATYVDLAVLLPNEIAERLSGARGVTANRIAREDWCGQARRLAEASRRVEAQLEGGREHWESYDLNLLVTEDDGIRSATMSHPQTGEIRRWQTGENPSLVGFIEATLDAARKGSSELSAIEGDTVNPMSARGSLPASRATALVMLEREQPPLGVHEPFTVSIALDLASVPADVTDLDYRAVVVARSLDRRSKHTLASATGVVSVRAPSIKLDCVGLPRGVYRIEAAVGLREPGSTRSSALAVSQESGILEVLAT